MRTAKGRSIRNAPRIVAPARLQDGSPLERQVAIASGVAGDIATLQALVTALQTDLAAAEAAIAALEADIVDKVDGPASSVDSEMALFSGATGKVLKRLTGDGIPLVSSGVVSVVPQLFDEVFNLQWNSVAFADLTFSASAGTWTVAAADLQYFKWLRLGTLLLVKCAVLNTDVSAGAGSELRIDFSAEMPVLTGNDGVCTSVYSEAGFAAGAQDVGQAILRAATNRIVFKTRTGANWAASVGATGMICGVVAGECVIP